MTSLNRNQFEALCKVFGQIWDEKTGQLEKDPSKGGRKPILRSAEERLFFILFYLKKYPLQEVLALLFGMSQGQAHFLIYQLSDILREALKRTGHLPARMPEEMIRSVSQDFLGPQYEPEDHRGRRGSGDLGGRVGGPRDLADPWRMLEC